MSGQHSCELGRRGYRLPTVARSEGSSEVALSHRPDTAGRPLSTPSFRESRINRNHCHVLAETTHRPKAYTL